jgi:exonuclease SbcD
MKTKLLSSSCTPFSLHDLQPRDVFRELLQEKHIEGDELSAVFDELLAIREQRAIA